MTRERLPCPAVPSTPPRPARSPVLRRPLPEQRRDALAPCVCWQIGNKHQSRHAASLSSLLRSLAACRRPGQPCTAPVKTLV